MLMSEISKEIFSKPLGRPAISISSKVPLRVKGRQSAWFRHVESPVSSGSSKGPPGKPTLTRRYTDRQGLSLDFPLRLQYDFTRYIHNKEIVMHLHANLCSNPQNNPRPPIPTSTDTKPAPRGPPRAETRPGSREQFRSPPPDWPAAKAISPARRLRAD